MRKAKIQRHEKVQVRQTVHQATGFVQVQVRAETDHQVIGFDQAQPGIVRMLINHLKTINVGIVTVPIRVHSVVLIRNQKRARRKRQRLKVLQPGTVHHIQTGQHAKGTVLRQMQRIGTLATIQINAANRFQGAHEPLVQL